MRQIMSLTNKIYVSRADLLREQSELAVLKDTQAYLKDGQDNPESDTQKEIVALNEEINRLKQQLKEQRELR